MASIRQIAADVFDTARDGIGWIALWKEGRGWNVETIFTESEDYGTGSVTVEAFEMAVLRAIIATDPRAILVNGYYHNLGIGEDYGSRESLARALRWQYEECSSQITDWTLNAAQKGGNKCQPSP